MLLVFWGGVRVSDSKIAASRKDAASSATYALAPSDHRQMVAQHNPPAPKASMGKSKNFF
jgi:hypothetical protein